MNKTIAIQMWMYHVNNNNHNNNVMRHVNVLLLLIRLPWNTFKYAHVSDDIGVNQTRIHRVHCNSGASQLSC